MRSEKEMYDLILGYAKAHDDIRAVILNGSRANPNRKPDPFNDFDIVYLVRNLQPYKTAPVHLDFGELLVYERTDENELFNEHFPEFVCYLMQFADGNRIDLTIAETARWHGYCFDDRLSVVLLDKDGALPPLPAPDESSHYIERPNAQTFFECRTEFWWIAPYVSKGLWRGQLLFAQTHMEICCRCSNGMRARCAALTGRPASAATGSSSFCPRRSGTATSRPSRSAARTTSGARCSRPASCSPRFPN